MTRRHTSTDGTNGTDASTDGSLGNGSRRDFLRTAGAGAGALAFGAGATGSASANQGDGPGQTISTPKLSVEGNHIVDPDGNTVKLRGLNVADPKMLDVTAQQRGKTAIQAIDFLTNRDQGWHPRIIRLPIEPGSVGELTPVPVAEDYETGDYPIGEFDESDLQAYCEEHLDDVVDRCEQRNVYCIIDYHRHWGGGDQEWNDPALDPEVTMFWDFMAQRYGDRDHVLFEVYNEPTEPGVWGDLLSDENGDPDHWQGNWLEWKEVAQPWVDTIREHSDNIVIVGSPGWSSSPEGALFEPFDGGNLAYTYHIYGGHVVSMNQNWDQNGIDAQGLAAGGTPVYEEHPVVVTEFGWERLSITDQHIQGTTEDFGEPFVEFIESHDSISWTAWCADPIWRPIMFERPFVDEDVVYEPEHMDAVGDPFNEDLEVYCEEPPCEWELLEEGDHGQTWMGDTIKSTLAEKKDDLVPERNTDLQPPTSPADQWTNEVTDTTIEMGWESVSTASSYNVFLDGDEVDSTASTTYTFDGLDPETEYVIGIQSENAEGTSERVETTVETLDDGGEGPCEGLDTMQVDGDTVCNVDGDDYYRDVNGDGNVGNRDVGAFFENFHLQPYDRDEFDYSGNGRVSHGDVVSLFDYVI